jgi:hypothetical protein
MRSSPSVPQPTTASTGPATKLINPDFRLLLDTRAAAGVLYVSPGYLEQLRTLGGGPQFLKLPGRGKAGYIVRYSRDSLEAWVRAQRSFSNTTEVDLNREP